MESNVSRFAATTDLAEVFAVIRGEDWLTLLSDKLRRTSCVEVLLLVWDLESFALRDTVFPVVDGLGL